MPATFVKTLNINRPPFGGIASVTPETGIALNTLFTITLD